jgi:hypothetical protein
MGQKTERLAIAEKERKKPEKQWKGYSAEVFVPSASPQIAEKRTGETR